MAKFELVSRFKTQTPVGVSLMSNAPIEEKNQDLLPTRGTKYAAGYDFCVAEDITIPSYHNIINNCAMTSPWLLLDALHPDRKVNIRNINELTLQDISDLTKMLKVRPTLVSTGVKCKLNPDQYLEVSVRSSTPLKHWLIMANSIGIIDADYYNNPDTEGEIFVPIINMFPYDITLKKGDKIAQGIIKHYDITEDDKPQGERTGGFGSTTVK